jgi:hypothetical protein
MADLLDIAPSTAAEAIKINGDMRLVVHGLNGNAIASIVARFPKLATLLGGGGENIGWHLIQHFGSAIGPIIAAGCGHLGDEEREERAANLLIEDQLKLVTAIFELTFPNGFGSFIDQLMALMNRADEGTKPYKVRLRKSLSPSQPSSDPDSPPTMQ